MKTNKQPEPKEHFQQHNKVIGVPKKKRKKKKISKRGWAKYIRENNEENVDIYNVDK